MSALSYNYNSAQKYDISGDEGGVARLAKRGNFLCVYDTLTAQVNTSVMDSFIGNQQTSVTRP